MKCFVHQSADAVGLCRNCSRGVCAECAADRPSGVACKGRCEAEVDAMDSLIRRNTAIGSRVTSVHWIQFVIFAALAVVATAVAVFSAVENGDYATAGGLGVGAIFMGVCALNLYKWINGARQRAE